MLEPAANVRDVSDRLCAEAARLHKAISAMAPNYASRLSLAHELAGVRTALYLVHGGADPDPTIPSSHPAGAIITDWWRRNQPDDWAGDDAVRTRHAEQLFLAMHELLVASGHDSPADLARAARIHHSTVCFVFGNPARSYWRTLEGPVNALGGHRDELWRLWKQAHKRPAKTIPPRRAGNGITPFRT